MSEEAYWRSVYREEGAHYNVFSCAPGYGMNALRKMFPDGIANEMNFVLFSTSGVHGSYQTIEECENGPDPFLTFLIVQPRRCSLLYGNCEPKTPEDFQYLKTLRESSHREAALIGAPAETPLEDFEDDGIPF